MRSLVRMTTVAAMVGMILSLASFEAEAGRNKDKKGTRYRVELRHPTTGGVVDSRVVDTPAQADALRAQFAKVHWKFWRYVGIGEKLHNKKFSSQRSANNYTPPFGVLESQDVKAGSVTVTKIPPPRKKKRK